MADEQNRPITARASNAGLTINGKVILRGINITLRGGEFCALLGPNGGGKTSLLNLLAHNLTPTQGTIEANPRTTALLPAELPETEQFTALEMTAMGRNPVLKWWRDYGEADIAAAKRAMRLTGTAGLENRLFRTLSSGEKQKILIAQALCRETPLLLLDEPTAHLDPRAANEIFTLLRDRADAGACILAATHDLSLAGAYADKIVLLKDGQTSYCGPCRENTCREAVTETFSLKNLPENPFFTH